MRKIKKKAQCLRTFMLSPCSHTFRIGSRWEAEGLAVGEKLPASSSYSRFTSWLSIERYYTPQFPREQCLLFSQERFVVQAKIFLDTPLHPSMLELLFLGHGL